MSEEQLIAAVESVPADHEANSVPGTRPGVRGTERMEPKGAAKHPRKAQQRWMARAEFPSIGHGPMDPTVWMFEPQNGTGLVPLNHVGRRKFDGPENLWGVFPCRTLGAGRSLQAFGSLCSQPMEVSFSHRSVSSRTDRTRLYAIGCV